MNLRPSEYVLFEQNANILLHEVKALYSSYFYIELYVDSRSYFNCPSNVWKEQELVIFGSLLHFVF